MIFGPKADGTYVVEFRTAEGHMQGDGRDCPMRVDAAPEGSCCGIEIANVSVPSNLPAPSR